MTKIRIERKTGWVGSAREIEIYIDDEKAGAIINDETQDYVVEKGRHIVYAKIDWDCSEKIEINSIENEIIILKLTQFKFISWILPINLGISLLYNFGKDTLNLKFYYFFILMAIVALYPFYYKILGKNKILRLTEIDEKNVLQQHI
jgi:hypothetical protein